VGGRTEEIRRATEIVCCAFVIVATAALDLWDWDWRSTDRFWRFALSKGAWFVRIGLGAGFFAAPAASEDRFGVREKRNRKVTWSCTAMSLGHFELGVLNNLPSGYRYKMHVASFYAHVGCAHFF
jgi:hypothetical protein